MSQLTLLPAVEQLALLRKEKISPLELAEEHIREIKRLNPQLNAIVNFTDQDAERIRSQARALMAASRPRGPLHGLPMTIKSSIAIAGLPCEIGSLLRQGDVAEEDALVVSRLRQAGANILGTTNCPEFLMAYETDNRLHGRTNNPWNLDFTSGGSSGGESAAIAAGMSAAGLGSDSGGSVRTPAHFTGICALKPTPGRIPAVGHVPPCVGPFSILGAVGPMARTMEDVGLLFETLCNPDVTDPASPPVPLRPISRNELKQIPIGYFEDDDLVPVTPGCVFEQRPVVGWSLGQVAHDRCELGRQGFRHVAVEPGAPEGPTHLVAMTVRQFVPRPQDVRGYRIPEFGLDVIGKPQVKPGRSQPFRYRRSFLTRYRARRASASRHLSSGSSPDKKPPVAAPDMPERPAARHVQCIGRTHAGEAAGMARAS